MVDSAMVRRGRQAILLSPLARRPPPRIPVMSFTSLVLAALPLCTPIAPAAPRAELAVRVNLVFDRSITSKPIKLAVREEAAATWRAYGIDLVFDDRPGPVTMSLDVFVDREDRRRSAPLVQVLGHTVIAPPPAAQVPIRISYDAVDNLLDHRHEGTPLVHDYILAVGLGRVIAHEIGHVLLGLPAFHDDAGLMRTTFLPDDLARPEPAGFRLAPHSVSRLRARIAALNGERSLDDCAGWSDSESSGTPDRALRVLPTAVR
jgi:hypothetical protein